MPACIKETELTKHVLITGGAGFIGSHLADELIRRGCRVRALDNLSIQVHGPEAGRPDYLNPEAELLIGDVRDPAAVEKALRGIDAVFHLAAAVGVGQSMYEIEKYTDVNSRGTAVLLEALVKRPVERLIVASSMSIYGEGLYRAPDGTMVTGAARTIEQLKNGEWEPECGKGVLTPMETPEEKPPSISSVYALSKYGQERMCMITGRAYGIQSVALRFFNAYGTRQSFSNPYTGVLAIFAARLMNGKPPLVYEDGGQQRDFVSVHDVVAACALALEAKDAAGLTFNVGSGSKHSILGVAGRMSAVFGAPDRAPEIAGKYRMGDIRHCFADISLARKVLKYEPKVTLEDGLMELSKWLEGRVASDRVAEASAELAWRGLTL